MAAHSYEIHIRSKDCVQLTSGYNTNFQVELSAGIHRIPNHKFHVSISSLELPWTWYSFSADPLNNTKLHLDSGATIFTLTDGNYTIEEMMDAINDDSSFPYTASYDVNSNKVTLTNTDSTSHTLSFGDVNSQGLAKALGFEAKDYTVGASGAQTATNCVNFQTVHSLFVYSDLAVANVITTTLGGYEKILRKIPLSDSAPHSIVEYNPYKNAPFAAIVSTNEIKTFNICIKDQNNNLIQLNGVNFEITLLVEFYQYGEMLEGPRHHVGVNNQRPDNHSHVLNGDLTHATKRYDIPDNLTVNEEPEDTFMNPPQRTLEELLEMDQQESEVAEAMINAALDL